jgi:hypothetical protein
MTSASFSALISLGILQSLGLNSLAVQSAGMTVLFFVPIGKNIIFPNSSPGFRCGARAGSLPLHTGGHQCFSAPL